MKSAKGFLSWMVIGCLAISGLAQAAEFPIKLDIDVSTKRTKKNIGAGSSGEAKVEMVQCRVKIRKAGGKDYTGKLTAELYIIGKQVQTGYYGILDVEKKTFTLTRENGNVFEFTSRAFPFGRTSGNINVGGEYETYLLVVVDEKGNIVATRSGRAIKERGIALIRKYGKNTLFDRDGNVVGTVDQSGSAFKKAIPAAVHDNDD